MLGWEGEGKGLHVSMYVKTGALHGLSRCGLERTLRQESTTVQPFNSLSCCRVSAPNGVQKRCDGHET